MKLKQIINIFLAVLMLFSLSFIISCGGGGSNNNLVIKSADESSSKSSSSEASSQPPEEKESTAPVVESSGEKPDWVDKVPFTTDKRYAKGFAFNLKEKEKGYEAAYNSGIAEISRQVVSDVSATVTKEVTVTTQEKNGNRVEEIQKKLEEKVRVDSDAILKNVRVEEEYWVKRSDGTFSYYVLIYMTEEDFQKALKDYEKRMMELLASIEGNIEKGKNMLAEGKISEGIGAFVVAAFNSTRNRRYAERFPEIEQLIKDTLTSIEFRKQNDRLSGTTEKGLEEPLRVQVLYKNKPAIDTSIRFQMEKGQSGSVYDKSAVTNDEGVAECDVDKVENPGSNIELDATLDLQRQLDMFDQIPQEKFSERKFQLQRLIANRKATFIFSAESLKRALKLVILPVEIDYKSAKRDRSPLASEILANLSDSGFNVQVANGISADENTSEEQAISMVKGKYPDAKRVLFIVSKVTNTRERQGSIYTYIRATVKLLNINNGDVIFSSTWSSNRSGNSEEESYLNVTAKAGRDFARRIATKIE